MRPSRTATRPHAKIGLAVETDRMSARLVARSPAEIGLEVVNAIIGTEVGIDIMTTDTMTLTAIGIRIGTESATTEVVVINRLSNQWSVALDLLLSEKIP